MSNSLTIICVLTTILSSLNLILLFFVWLNIPGRQIRKFFNRKEGKHEKVADYESFVYQIASALFQMSKKRIGALIIIENKDNLDKYIELGYSITAKLSRELLTTVFSSKDSSLHDGGVIVRKYDIVSVSSYFPVTQTKLITDFGSRHRAAAGLTEHTDAIAFIVSESSGRVSYSFKGKIYEMYSGNVDSISDEIFNLLLDVY